jgi:hypothetical protein
MLLLAECFCSPSASTRQVLPLPRIEIGCADFSQSWRGFPIRFRHASPAVIDLFSATEFEAKQQDDRGEHFDKGGL